MDASQNRREFKFVLPPGMGEAMQACVSEFLSPDRDAADGYPVLSEYFDTDGRASYWEKQFGVTNRRRVRSRVYGRRDGGIPACAFIEVKHKLEGVTVKRRVSADLEELEGLSHGMLPVRIDPGLPGDIRVLAEIVDLLNGRDSHPVVQIRYHRFAYDSGPEGTIRITFDVDPRCRFRLMPLTPDDPDFELPLLEPGASIMEVKTIGPVPYWFRNLIGEHGLVPRGFSKYAIALELYEFKVRPRISPAPAKEKPAGKALHAKGADSKDRRRPAATATVARRTHPLPARTRGIFRRLLSRCLSFFREQPVASD